MCTFIQRRTNKFSGNTRNFQLPFAIRNLIYACVWASVSTGCRKQSTYKIQKPQDKTCVALPQADSRVRFCRRRAASPLSAVRMSLRAGCFVFFAPSRLLSGSCSSWSCILNKRISACFRRLGGEFRPGTFDGALKIDKEERKWRTEKTGFLENYFGLRQHGTTVRTEALAGVTTLIAIAYILMLNPQVLADPYVMMGDAWRGPYCR